MTTEAYTILLGGLFAFNVCCRQEDDPRERKKNANRGERTALTEERVAAAESIAYFK